MGRLPYMFPDQRLAYPRNTPPSPCIVIGAFPYLSDPCVVTVNTVSARVTRVEFSRWAEGGDLSVGDLQLLMKCVRRGGRTGPFLSWNAMAGSIPGGMIPRRGFTQTLERGIWKWLIWDGTTICSILLAHWKLGRVPMGSMTWPGQRLV